MNNEHIHYDTTELNAIPFSSVITRLEGTLERKGRTLVTKCPWHDDHHPSLVLYEDSNRCVCYACSERKARSVIDYVMQVKGYSFRDACEWLSPSPPAPEGGVGRRVGSPLPPVIVRSATLSEKERGMGRRVGSPPAPKGGVSKRTKRKKQSIKELLAMDDMNTQRKITNRRPTPPSGAGGLDMDFLSSFVSSDNSFCKCLKFIFPEEIVNVVTQLYMLGCYSGLGNSDDVLFPSIDSKLRVTDVKVQHYDCNPQSPNFFHCDKKHIFWLSSILKRKAPQPPNGEQGTSTQQANGGKPEAHSPFGGWEASLFGEHLLKDNPDMPVALVESPKNAVVGACEFPSLVWVAAGNKGNISRKSLSCLFNRDVLVLPDYDAIDEWKEKISKLGDIAAFTFSPFNENQLLECGAKGDIADWIIMKKKEK